MYIYCFFAVSCLPGGDIDADCLGLLDHAEDLPHDRRSKNSRFRRKVKGTCEEWSQLNSSARTNFEYYGMETQLKDLVACSIESWTEAPPSSISQLDTYGLFDAVRERAKSGLSFYSLTYLRHLHNRSSQTHHLDEENECL